MRAIPSAPAISRASDTMSDETTRATEFSSPVFTGEGDRPGAPCAPRVDFAREARWAVEGAGLAQTNGQPVPRFGQIDQPK